MATVAASSFVPVAWPLLGEARGRSGRRSFRVATAALSVRKDGNEQQETDVVVIGAGIGGLSCAAMAAKYGLDVSVALWLTQLTRKHKPGDELSACILHLKLAGSCFWSTGLHELLDAESHACMHACMHASIDTHTIVLFRHVEAFRCVQRILLASHVAR